MRVVSYADEELSFIVIHISIWFNLVNKGEFKYKGDDLDLPISERCNISHLICEEKRYDLRTSGFLFFSGSSTDWNLAEAARKKDNFLSINLKYEGLIENENVTKNNFETPSIVWSLLCNKKDIQHDMFFAILFFFLLFVNLWICSI